MPHEHDDDDGWYWDLSKGVAVPASERGPADHVLGPYPTRAAAENWRSTVEQRNEVWDADDAEWYGDEPGAEHPGEPGPTG